MHLYTQEWYRNLQKGARRSANTIVPLVVQLVQPQRVIDVGCGVGTWLSVFRECGIEEVFGIDGAHVPVDMLEIPAECFSSYDLKHPFRIDARFDLVVSLEVAEHLPPASAGAFVESLTTLGPVVLFSAAIPLQGGEHHVNEQWPDYWAALFQQRGFVAIDCLRKQIWQEAAVEWWYAQNILLFAQQEYLATHPALRREAALTAAPQLSLVHPRRFLASHQPRLSSAVSPAPAGEGVRGRESEGAIWTASGHPLVASSSRPLAPPRTARTPLNEQSALSWTELRRYLGTGFCFDWLTECGHARSGLDSEAVPSGGDPACPACLYAHTTRELSGVGDASCALLRSLAPTSATVLAYGSGIGTAGLRLLEDGYRVQFANGSTANARYLRWRLAERGLEAPVWGPHDAGLPRVDVVLCTELLESTAEAQGLLRTVEAQADLVIATLVQADPAVERAGPPPAGAEEPALLAGIRCRYPVIAIDRAEPTPGRQLVTVAYFTGMERPLVKRDLRVVDLSSPSLLAERLGDSTGEVLWLLEGGEPNEAGARWHSAFHQQRPERWAVAAGPTWPHPGALNLSVKRSFLLSAMRQSGLDGIPVDAATVEAALALAGAGCEPLPAAYVAQAKAPALAPPTERAALAVWLGSSAGRAAAHAGALANRAGGLSAPDRPASVVLIAEGSDPQPVLQTLSALAAEWRDDWELVLVSRCGSACETATLYLEGDFRLIRNPEPVGFDVALNQAALIARGERLLIPTDVGPFWISRELFLAGGGARGFEEREALAGLLRPAPPRIAAVSPKLELTRC